MLGHDTIHQAYRVAIGGGPVPRIVGRGPDHVIATGVTLTGGHGHATAYDWLDRHSRQIEQTLRTLAGGGRVKPPYDLIELEKED